MDEPARVLVVDDDVDILDALTYMLEDDGYEVKTSDKAVYAESLADSDATLPDLIVLDVLLSGKDGRTICRQLKAAPRTQGVPVLMISAHPNAGPSVLEAGADAFLAKPFSIDEFLGTVSELLNKRGA